jgi:hypothetical protein
MALLLSTVQRMVEVCILGIDQTPRLATVVGLMIHGVGPTMAAILVAEIGDVAPGLAQPSRCAPGRGSPPTPGFRRKTVPSGITKPGLQAGAQGVE